MGKINPALEQVVKIVRDNPNKYSYSDLAVLSGLSYDSITSAIRRYKQKYILQVKPETPGPKPGPQPKRRQEYIPAPPDTQNVLVIGDLHEPFTLDEYLDFCVETHKKYNITHVIFTGDIIDNHASSFHIPDPDAMGAGTELEMAQERIARWVNAFPKADVILGNHDLIIMRKAFEGRIPRQWIMNFQDVLNAPGWNFTERAMYDGIQYIHGLGGSAINKARKDLMSTVQGHIHTEAYTEYIVGETFKVFGMQVGCGVDRKSYAMAYARHWPKQVVGVGVILEHGKLPFNVLMEL